MRPAKPFLFLLIACALAAGCAPAGNSASSVDTASNQSDSLTTQIASGLQGSPAAPGSLLVVPLNLPVNSDGVPLVARVNASDITQDELARALQHYQPQQTTSAEAAALQLTVLETLIEQELIVQAASAQNVQVTDDEVQSEIQASIELAGSESAWQQWLAENRYTPEEFRETLRDTLITGRMRDIVTQEISGNLLQVRARHILVPTEDTATELLSRINAGEDFAALAQAYSSDVTTREQGGDLGWFAQGTLLEPYLAEVAFSLEPGQLAGPIPTSLGFHIIQSIERAERPVPDEERASLAQSQFEQWLQELRQTATIERYL